MVRNGQKWLKIPKNSQNGSNTPKIPDFVMKTIFVSIQVDEIIEIATSERMPPITLVCVVLRVGQLD